MPIHPYTRTPSVKGPRLVDQITEEMEALLVQLPLKGEGVLGKELSGPNLQTARCLSRKGYAEQVDDDRNPQATRFVRTERSLTLLPDKPVVAGIKSAPLSDVRRALRRLLGTEEASRLRDLVAGAGGEVKAADRLRTAGWWPEHGVSAAEKVLGL